MLKKVLVLSVIFLLVSSPCFAFEINTDQVLSWIDQGVAFFNEHIVPLWNQAVVWAENNLSEQMLDEIKKEVNEASQQIPVVVKAIWEKVLSLFK